MLKWRGAKMEDIVEAVPEEAEVVESVVEPVEERAVEPRNEGRHVDDGADSGSA